MDLIAQRLQQQVNAGSNPARSQRARAVLILFLLTLPPLSLRRPRSLMLLQSFSRPRTYFYQCCLEPIFQIRLN